ncbi:MAG TPA: DNA polymerase Y family protein [Acidobacteriaceae bacterium]|nr:DNA polymerase Y family protein [Acidobacteriaceae bacterium]
MTPPTLYACLYVREFPAQARLRLRSQIGKTPVVILEGTPPRQTVCSCNARARDLGIETGLTRAELDVFSGVTHLLRSLSEESCAYAALLQCAGRFSPRVECLTPQLASDKSSAMSDAASDTYSFAAILDITGTEKLIGPPPILAKKLLAAVRALGLHAAIVISANIDAALCLARSLGSRTTASATSSPVSGWSTAVIPTGDEATALAPLPIFVLPLTADHAETLTRWGIFTLGALAALPEKELIARLGQHGLRLRQLARGEAPHLLVPVDPPFNLEERTELEAPVELLDSLLFVLGVLLDQLIARAAAQILALASVTVTLVLDGGSTHTRTVRPALPGNDRRLWLRLLHLDLQAHPPSAAILAIAVAAEPGSTSKVQQGLFTPQLPEPDRLDVTLARIRSLVGDNRVGRAVLEDTHRPDAFRVERFSIDETRPTTPTATAAATLPVAQKPAHTARRRLRPPEPITVTLSERRPVALVFRNQRYTVERAWGPWFFSGNWWGIECWSMEKWDLVARSDGDAGILSCAIARNPLRPATLNDWRLEEFYD